MFIIVGPDRPCSLLQDRIFLEIGGVGALLGALLAGLPEIHRVLCVSKFDTRPWPRIEKR